VSCCFVAFSAVVCLEPCCIGYRPLLRAHAFSRRGSSTASSVVENCPWMAGGPFLGRFWPFRHDFLRRTGHFFILLCLSCGLRGDRGSGTPLSPSCFGLIRIPNCRLRWWGGKFVVRFGAEKFMYFSFWERFYSKVLCDHPSYPIHQSNASLGGGGRLDVA